MTARVKQANDPELINLAKLPILSSQDRVRAIPTGELGNQV